MYPGFKRPPPSHRRGRSWSQIARAFSWIPSSARSAESQDPATGTIEGWRNSLRHNITNAFGVYVHCTRTRPYPRDYLRLAAHRNQCRVPSTTSMTFKALDARRNARRSWDCAHPRGAGYHHGILLIVLFLLSERRQQSTPTHAIESSLIASPRITNTARPTTCPSNASCATLYHERLVQYIDQARARLASPAGARAGTGTTALAGSAHGVVGIGGDVGRI